MGIIVLVIAAFVVISFVTYVVGIYNNLVQLRFNIDKSWANIDVLLKQRRDELPKIVDTCKAYMKYERDLLDKLTAARTAFLNAKDAGAKIEAENQISRVLKSVFAVAENYPDLKANQNFLQLQSRVSALESTIADRREFFNDSVNLYNIRIHQFPDMYMAKSMSYLPWQLLEIPEEDKKDVKLDFGMAN